MCCQPADHYGHRRRLSGPEHAQVLSYFHFTDRADLCDPLLKENGKYNPWRNRYLLKFGQVTHYLGYNALQDFFPTMSMKPNETCDDAYCRQRQREYRELQAEFPDVDQVPAAEAEVVHDDNEWGISLVDESAPVEPSSARPEIAPGIHAAYEVPETDALPTYEEAIDTSMSLEELMAQMKAI